MYRLRRIGKAMRLEKNNSIGFFWTYPRRNLYYGWRSWSTDSSRSEDDFIHTRFVLTWNYYFGVMNLFVNFSHYVTYMYLQLLFETPMTWNRHRPGARVSFYYFVRPLNNHDDAVRSNVHVIPLRGVLFGRYKLVRRFRQIARSYEAA